MVGSPKRREIGHGLAKRGALAVMPDMDKSRTPFAWRLRKSPNPTVLPLWLPCAALPSGADGRWRAPIKAAVAGIAMSGEKKATTTTLYCSTSGRRRSPGRYGLQSGGSRDLQLLRADGYQKLKVSKRSAQAVRESCQRRVCTSRVMEQAINTRRYSEFAPRIHTIKISTDKIKDVIGKGGSVIPR